MTEPTKTEHYKIVNFHAENVKKLKVVDITPDPEATMITIAGRNGQGKTSILDSIVWALGGADYFDDKPIRDGEERAEITLDLGKYVVHRSFTQKGSYIKVSNKEGLQAPSPQKMLDDLLGGIAFDPLEFTRADGKKQYATLRSLVKLDIDIEALDAASKKDYDERTLVNRIVADLEGQVKDKPFADDTPDESVDVAELVKQRDAMQLTHTLAKEMDVNLTREKQVIDAAKAAIDDLEAQLAHKKQALAILETNQRTHFANRQEFHVVPEPEILIVSEKINSAGNVNRMVQAKTAWLDKAAQLSTKKTESERLTANIEERKQQKEDALARANMPIEGLSFSDGTVIYNGIPFDQASDAEKIKVSLAIAIAMNPKLRVIRIKEGVFLDDQSMETVRQIAHANDFQVWIEVIKSDDPCAVYIEDGEVA